MLGQKGFEGVYTLIKALESLPFEKQEDFLKSQKNTTEGEIVVVRKGTSFALDVIQKAQGGSFTPEVAKKADEDTIGDDGHVKNDGKSTKSEEVDLEKSNDDEKKEDDKFIKEPEEEKDHEDDTNKTMKSVVEFNKMFEEIEKSS